MIKVENVEVWGWEHAIRGMRNPMNSWGKSDTVYGLGEDRYTDMVIGPNDLSLMQKLFKGGTEHRKYLRQIFVSLDITDPLYWWKEFDTYKVGTVANSTSTMHRIHSKEFGLEDFSCDRMTEESLAFMESIVKYLEKVRTRYLETKDKRDWYDLIQLLPSSYNQMRTVTMNYENVSNMYYARRNHKLDEWHVFCRWIEKLPYAGDFILVRD